MYLIKITFSTDVCIPIIGQVKSTRRIVKIQSATSAGRREMGVLTIASPTRTNIMTFVLTLKLYQ